MHKRTTQVDRVIAYMKQFGSVSTLEAFKDLGVTRLSARIFEIKQRGYKVKSEPIKAKNRFGEDVRYFRYSLEEQG